MNKTLWRHLPLIFFGIVAFCVIVVIVTMLGYVVLESMGGVMIINKAEYARVTNEWRGFEDRWVKTIKEQGLHIELLRLQVEQLRLKQLYLDD